jgi:alanyl-tRNA synthetase
MRWTTDRIRQSFLDFFRDNGHVIVPSAPLVPKGDPTLLFTNAGMVQFKDYFLGIRKPPTPRVADCQKCLRISGKHNDLEAVGRDSYHHTFFEMLGNWSFGDYYKRRAIELHWKLMTEVWEIPKDRLWATVYKDDDEAEQAWLELGFLPRERILRFGEKDNFWEMGETGPCGPCSEIHIDRGPEAAKDCTHPGKACAVNVEGCARFIELANLVFIQFNRDAAGKLTPLPMKHVDTGTGLERVAAVLQSLETGRVLGNYDIDLFRAIINEINNVSASLGRSVRYGLNAKSDVSFRVIADHARAISFLLGEGVKPGNSGRDYVLRRLVRRATRHGFLLNIVSSPHGFLRNVCQAVIREMHAAYPELREAAGTILQEVEREETEFAVTLGSIVQRLNVYIDDVLKTERRIFPGNLAFELHDTYGFPLELTQDECRESGLEVDVPEFNRLMEEQRERARAAAAGHYGLPPPYHDLRSWGAAPASTPSRFIGEHRYDAESEIRAAHRDPDNRLIVVTAETPFYPEGGGQVGDRGVIETENGSILEVADTRKSDGQILHIGRVVHGEPGAFERGSRVKLIVDRIRRDAAMLNHSATHILHYALRDVLGTAVHQAGSLVAPDRLRFDFSHTGPVAENDLTTIEEEINALIRENAAVTTEEMAYDDAIKAGALAFFGDKYGDRVRVVRMGDFSIELCGGTHVDRTGDVGVFKLEGESGVAAGVRRIEAVTGQGALEAIRRRERILDAIGGHLGARDEAALERLERMLAREKELEKRLRALEQKLASGDGGSGTAETVREVGGVKLVTRRVEGVEARALREIADRLRQKYGSAVVALGSTVDNRVALLVAVTPDLASRFKAGEIIKQIAPIVGGSGGGRADFAQAGGHDPARLDEALDRVAALLE